MLTEVFIEPVNMSKQNSYFVFACEKYMKALLQMYSSCTGIYEKSSRMVQKSMGRNLERRLHNRSVCVKYVQINDIFGRSSSKAIMVEIMFRSSGCCCRWDYYGWIPSGVEQVHWLFFFYNAMKFYKCESLRENCSLSV